MRLEWGKLLTISLFVAFSIHRSRLDFGQTKRKTHFWNKTLESVKPTKKFYLKRSRTESFIDHRDLNVRSVALRYLSLILPILLFSLSICFHSFFFHFPLFFMMFCPQIVWLFHSLFLIFLLVCLSFSVYFTNVLLPVFLSVCPSVCLRPLTVAFLLCESF